MSHYIERSSKGWNCMSGKRYSVERFAYIFKTAVKFKKTTGEYPLPSHLSDIALVTFKVANKAIIFVAGNSKSLHKPRGHTYSGKGSLKLSMIDQFFLLSLYNKEPTIYMYSYVKNSTIFFRNEHKYYK